MWLVFKVAGLVVLTVGYPGMTLEQCNEIKELVIADTMDSVREDATDEGSEGEWNDWPILSCELEMPELD